jgi:site-specific DNA-methyltransferase (cytosine-N4-specific)
MAIKDSTIEVDKLGRLISDFRDKQAWSQGHLAEKLGVSRITISRWEKGESSPSLLAIKQLENLMGSKEVVKSALQEAPTKEEKNKTVKFKHGSIIKEVTPTPYVLNGPKDQNDFHLRLIKLQQPSKSENIDWDIYKKRLSLVESVETENTSQNILEAPKQNAKSWNSNYGSHGWHRYVGRFPPHVVRALLNHFQAGPDDLVCDPFMGSGTTLVEARLLGIPSIGIEICPLSCAISKVKAGFPESTQELRSLIPELEDFYQLKRDGFIKQHPKFTHQQILERKGNNISSFANIEKWFTVESLLGVSIVTEFAGQKKGYARDALLIALSAKMRSIGNVDVDVIRAEYSKKPRMNVDVLKFVRNQLLKMIGDIDAMTQSHEKTILKKNGITIKKGSVLNVDLPKNSISHIITSPPYGIESLSYLRTHLLSYRSLGYFLKTDPYDFGSDVIGSEYLSKERIDPNKFSVSKISKTYRAFFDSLVPDSANKNHQIRIGMMMKFFEDMSVVVSKFQEWVKPGGKVAFVIGNKRIDQHLIPTDKIMGEIFAAKKFTLDEVLSHKLKTNNSNSRVPWQDRIIDQEFIMIFTKK